MTRAQRREHARRARAYRATPHGRAVSRRAQQRYRAKPSYKAINRAQCERYSATRRGHGVKMRSQHRWYKANRSAIIAQRRRRRAAELHRLARIGKAVERLVIAAVRGRHRSGARPALSFPLVCAFIGSTIRAPRQWRHGCQWFSNTPSNLSILMGRGV